MTFIAFRKRVFSKEQIYLTPEEWGKRILDLEYTVKRMLDTMPEISSRYEKAQDITRETVGEIKSALLTYLNKIDEKEKEIHRLKQGYDNYLVKTFIKRFISVDRELKDLLTIDDLSHEDIEALASLMGNALEECGVELFYPEIDDDYRNHAADVDSNPRIEETDDPAKDYNISEIILPGYRFTEGAQQIIAKSKVKILRLQKE